MKGLPVIRVPKSYRQSFHVTYWYSIVVKAREITSMPLSAYQWHADVFSINSHKIIPWKLTWQFVSTNSRYKNNKFTIIDLVKGAAVVTYRCYITDIEPITELH